MTRNPASMVPRPLLALVTLLLVALGFALHSILTPPLLLGCLVYLLLPYRHQRWVLRTLAVLLVFACFWLVARFGTLLLVLGISLFLAYLLDPAVDFLQRRHLPRSLAILSFLVPVLALVALALILVLPPLVHELTQLFNSIPDLARQIQERLRPAMESPALQPFAERYQDQIPRLLQYLQQGLLTGLGAVLGATQRVGGAVSALVLVPFITFYFLRDYDRLRLQGANLVPRKYHAWFSDCGSELDRLLGTWLRGAGIVATIVGVATGVGLVLMGIPYALLLAALAALLNFVPVLGFWISLLTASLVALIGAGWDASLEVIALYLGISIVEGQILQPKIVGESVGLHPVAMILALIVFADLFGLLGAFLAMPLALLLLVLGRQIRTLYLASDLYDTPEEDRPVRS